MGRSGGWLCDMCAASGVRVINHTLGGLDDKQGWRVTPGFVVDHFHSWVKCVVGPGKVDGVAPSLMEEHESMLINMRNTEVEMWVDEDDDDEEFLAIINDVETGFGNDDDNLMLALAV